MWKLTSSDELVVALPKRLTGETLGPFVGKIVNENGDARCKKLILDFSNLEFIEPAGMVVLSNLIEYLRKVGGEHAFSGIYHMNPGIVFLDDAGFFRHYLGSPLRHYASLRDTTLPLELIANPRAIGYLYGNMMPWMAQQLKTTEIALATVRVCLQEIFHNISDHSGVNVGCVFAQHFPNLKKIEIAISDFGLGIPFNVRKLIPELNDAQALAKAVEEGFTTKSNVQNRGAGLALLIRYVTLKNQGVVFIDSCCGNISAVNGSTGSKITARDRQEHYPGTLVRVILRTDTLDSLAHEIEREEFSW